MRAEKRRAEPRRAFSFPSVFPFGTGPFVHRNSDSAPAASDRPPLCPGRARSASALASFRDCCTSRTPLNSQSAERGNERMRMGRGGKNKKRESAALACFLRASIQSFSRALDARGKLGLQRRSVCLLLTHNHSRICVIIYHNFTIWYNNLVINHYHEMGLCS